MNKVVLVVLVFCLAFGLFADDAKVLPAGVFRFYLVPSYAFGTESFDPDGDKVDFAEGDYTFFNLGAALEYGVSDAISAAVQWAPGANLYSKFADNDYVTADGLFELFVGAKMQVLGEQGFVKNDTFRFAVAPGVMIPMNFGYDAEAEASNYVQTAYYSNPTEFNKDPANSAFGLGARLYADYVINEMFFVNLYGEYIYYLEKDADTDFEGAAAIELGVPYETVNYGYKLTGELDFNFSKPIADGLILSGGLPVVFKTSPQKVYDDAEADSDATSYTLAINPDVNLFVTSLPLPLEFKVSYSLPLAGQNAMATNTLTAQIKAYMKF